MVRPQRVLDEFKPDSRLIDERGPIPERLAKAGEDVERGNTGTIAVRSSQIERAYRRGMIDNNQYRAAGKLRYHWYRASMAGTIGASDPSRIPSRGQGFTHENGLVNGEAHWNRLTSACNVVRQKTDDAGQNGQDAIKILESVVCHEQTFRDAGQGVGNEGGKAAQHYAIILTKGSLNILAREWGFH